MGTLVLSGDTSGSITLDAPAVAGSSVQTLVAATGTLAPLISDTAKSATGTAVDFTGIPSWAKRITVMFSGVSTNGASVPQVQLGSGSITTSGYSSGGTAQASTNLVNGGNLTTGFAFTGSWASAIVVHGHMVITALGSNSYVSSCIFGRTDAAATQIGGGSVTLSGTLDRVRITTVNGTDTFDAGTINIMYE